MPWGKYEYQRLPMGLCNSPDIKQEHMSELFYNLEYVRACIDDLLTFTKGSFEDYLKKLDKVSGSTYSKIPFDIHSNNVSNTKKQKLLLVPALCTSTDLQGGVRFARIGSESDGFAHEILSIPGMGVDGSLILFVAESALNDL